jgi:protein TonB
METKKNPSKDLGLQRNKFFLIGLVASTSILFTAFEWQTVKENPKPREVNLMESEITFVAPATAIEPPKVQQPTLRPKPTQSNSSMPTDFVPIDNATRVDDVAPIDLGDIGNLPSTVVFTDPKDDEGTEVFIIVEKNPEPKEGFASFYKLLSKNLKYPSQAKQMGIEGKVFIEFVVNKNGEPSDLKIIRGIGAGCDEEAMRVLALTKWEPGKQRGKPVRVKMVMPISFILSN